MSTKNNTFIESKVYLLDPLLFLVLVLLVLVSPLLLPLLLPRLGLGDDEDWRGHVHSDLAPDLAEVPVCPGLPRLAFRQTLTEQGAAVWDLLLGRWDWLGTDHKKQSRKRNQTNFEGHLLIST